jgi:integrase/recombinase XerD
VNGELRRRAEEYLQMRHGLGYELQRPGRLVRQFAGHCDAAGITHVTIQAALDWATLPQETSSWYQWLRLSAVRGFAAYLHALDPAHQIPPADLLPCQQQRPTPCLLGGDAISALMAAAAALRPPLHAATYQTLTGLAAVTGIRPCEVARMDDRDVEPASRVMTVHGKNHKDRKILLHPTTLAALAGYARLRDEVLGHRAGPSFFVSIRGTRMSEDRIRAVFANLVSRAGLTPLSATRGPTLNSLRHSFAVTTLIGWLGDDTDVEANLPALSAWTGHKKPRSTYWYLQAVPELLQAASDHMTRAAARQPPAASPHGTAGE